MCVRGLLCHACNNGIVRFKHDPAVIRRIADWLEAANAKVAERVASTSTQEELPLGPGGD